MNIHVFTRWRGQLRSLYRGVQGAVREWIGDADYERYVGRCARLRQPPLDRGRFLAQRLEEHYRTRGRCC